MSLDGIWTTLKDHKDVFDFDRVSEHLRYVIPTCISEHMRCVCTFNTPDSVHIPDIVLSCKVLFLLKKMVKW